MLIVCHRVYGYAVRPVLRRAWRGVRHVVGHALAHPLLPVISIVCVAVPGALPWRALSPPVPRDDGAGRAAVAPDLVPLGGGGAVGPGHYGRLAVAPGSLLASPPGSPPFLAPAPVLARKVSEPVLGWAFGAWVLVLPVLRRKRRG